MEVILTGMFNSDIALLGLCLCVSSKELDLRSFVGEER